MNGRRRWCNAIQMATFIRDLFDQPGTVRGGDFVLRLDERFERPDQTVRDYVVTPQWGL